MCRSVPVKNNKSKVSAAFIINAVESNTMESDSLPLVIGIGFVKSPQMVLLGIKRKQLVAPSNTIKTCGWRKHQSDWLL